MQARGRFETFTATIISKESTDSVKSRELLCNSEAMRDVGYVAALGLLFDLIRISETQGYTGANADKVIEHLSEKLNVLSITGNPAAGSALNELVAAKLTKSRYLVEPLCCAEVED